MIVFTWLNSICLVQAQIYPSFAYLNLTTNELLKIPLSSIPYFSIEVSYRTTRRQNVLKRKSIPFQLVSHGIIPSKSELKACYTLFLRNENLGYFWRRRTVSTSWSNAIYASLFFGFQKIITVCQWISHLAYFHSTVEAKCAFCKLSIHLKAGINAVNFILFRYCCVQITFVSNHSPYLPVSSNSNKCSRQAPRNWSIALAIAQGYIENSSTWPESKGSNS